MIAFLIGDSLYSLTLTWFSLAGRTEFECFCDRLQRYSRGLGMLLITMAIWVEHVENLWYLGFNRMTGIVQGGI